MSNEELFPVNDLCRQYKAEVSFIHELQDNGLVEIIEVENTEYVDTEVLSDVERFIRMHYELSINLEGLEAITHLLQRMENMQQQLLELHNRLSIYETES